VARYSLPTLNWLDMTAEGGVTAGPPLDEILAGAAAAGFDAVGLDLLTVREYVRAGGRLDDVPALLGAHGLRCTDVGVLAVDGPAPADATELAALARAVEAPLCIVAWSVASGIEGLLAAADVVSAAGARLALEFVPYGGMPSLPQAIAACEAVGWDRCGLLVDTWHFFRSGAAWPQLRALEAGQIALVHVNDGPASAGADLMFESRSRRLPLGAGTFAVAEFLEAIEANGYDGPISAEVLSSTLRARPPADGARTLMDALRAYWPLRAESFEHRG
jgi:sugar phosphate isomerase/epimerase